MCSFTQSYSRHSISSSAARRSCRHSFTVSSTTLRQHHDPPRLRGPDEVDQHSRPTLGDASSRWVHRSCRSWAICFVAPLRRSLFEEESGSGVGGVCRRRRPARILLTRRSLCGRRCVHCGASCCAVGQLREEVMASDLRLIDFGERRLVEEVLAARYGSTKNWGDDAALAAELSPGARWVVATTDPCPPPMAVSLGFNDWYYTGWLLATINLSDIAAAGAHPAGLLSSLNLPADTLLSDFTRLLDGLDSCCAAAETRVIGGNLKETPEVSLSGTAIGYCQQPPLSRHGAQPNDTLYLIGEVGLVLGRCPRCSGRTATG